MTTALLVLLFWYVFCSVGVTIALALRRADSATFLHQTTSWHTILRNARGAYLTGLLTTLLVWVSAINFLSTPARWSVGIVLCAVGLLFGVLFSRDLSNIRPH